MIADAIKTSYTLIPREDLMPAELSLIQDYWQMREGKFTYKPAVVAQRHGFTLPALQRTIRTLSHCKVHMGYCQDCHTALTKQVHTQNALTVALRYPEEWCDTCKQLRSEQWDNALQEHKVRHQAWLREQHLNAIAALRRDTLSPALTLFLFQLVERRVTTVKDFYQHLGIGKDPRRERKAWAKLHQLAQAHLLRLEYDDVSLRVTHIHYDEALARRVSSLREAQEPTCQSVSIALVSLLPAPLAVIRRKEWLRS